MHGAEKKKKISVVAGLVPTMNPFMRSLWKLGAEKGVGRADDTAPPGANFQGRRGRSLPTQLVSVSQISATSRGCGVLGQTKGITREGPPVDKLPESERMRLSGDVSPWGLGGTLVQGSPRWHKSRTISRRRISGGSKPPEATQRVTRCKRPWPYGLASRPGESSIAPQGVPKFGRTA